MNPNQHIKIDCEQDQPKSFEMFIEDDVRLKYNDDEASRYSETGELESDAEEDEQLNESAQQYAIRPATVKQEFDIESLTSSTRSTGSPPPVQQPTAPGLNTYEKKQTFLAAQLAEPNEGSSHFSQPTKLSSHQQLHVDHEANEKLHHQHQRATTSHMSKSGSHASHRSQVHKSSNQRQQHDFGNTQNNNNNNNNNIDYDEHVKHVDLFGVKIVALTINSKERLCLAQISNTLLKNFSYNEIHNRRVALGITCVQCTPIQLEMLRRAGAMPSSSRRCGMITMREAERLCRSFLAEEQPPELPENFYFTVGHRVNYGCKGRFIPSRYISSRAKCIECFHCGEFYSPNKFIFHSHKQPEATDCNPPDSPNINSWRKHINLDWTLEHSQEIKYAWEDVKSLFNGGTRRRASATSAGPVPGNACSAMSAANSTAAREGGTSPPHSHQTKSTLAVDDMQQKIDVHIVRQSSGKSSLAPMSQSERRKLPMSSWPGICATQAALSQHTEHQRQPPAPAKRLHASLTGHNQFAGGHQQPLKKMAPPSSQWAQPINNQRSPASYSSEQHARNAPKQQPQSLASQTSASILSNPLAGNHHYKESNLDPYGPPRQDTAAPSSFIYGQLYSQLMKSQLNQQQAVTNLEASNQQQHQSRHISSTLDAQLALRHHIWSSLLANIRCNPNAFEATVLHSELPTNAAAAQTQNSSSILSPNCLTAATTTVANPQTNNQAGMTHDLSNQSPPYNHLNPLYSLLPPMRLYGGGSSPAGQVRLANELTTLFNSGTSDSCK